MAVLKGSKTEQNLVAAFHGESSSRSTYTTFASVAKAEGHLLVAAAFLLTADQEKEHGRFHLNALARIGDTAANLRAAIDSETQEAEKMYPRMAAEARAEGFDKIAQVFEHLGRIERDHAERFKALLVGLETGTVPQLLGAVRWTCPECGFPYEGVKQKPQCPVCQMVAQ